MNTPTILSNAKLFLVNHSRITYFTLVALTAVAVMVAIVLTPTDGNPFTGMEDTVVASYSNALEMQYAHPWIESQNNVAIPYSKALEMQYAQSWLNAQKLAAVRYGNALEMQYAQPWLDAQYSTDCHSRLDLVYTCQYGLRSNGK